MVTDKTNKIKISSFGTELGNNRLLLIKFRNQLDLSCSCNLNQLISTVIVMNTHSSLLHL